MTSQLSVTLGSYSAKGRKEVNQDFHGACIPREPELSSKGITLAIADGISSSEVSQEASATTVKSFLDDYYCTAEAWSVRKSAQKVLAAMNSWLYAQTRNSQYRYDQDRGYVCTLSALILKSNTAHLLHVGDSRIYRIRGSNLEQLTEDHQLRLGEEKKTYLSRAMGIKPQLEIDYDTQLLQVGDIFMLSTDGVHEWLQREQLFSLLEIHGSDLDAAAQALVAAAYAAGSTDNLTLQLLKVENLPNHDAAEHYQQLTSLPFPPALQEGMDFDGYRVLRQLHSSSRSHIFLVQDRDSGQQAVLKSPSVDLRGQAAYLEAFLMEEWIARRLDNPHVVKAFAANRRRHYLYTVNRYVGGRTLSQWLRDNPQPALEKVRDIVEQVARGLQAFHRMEMLHQDLRPDNIMIDGEGFVTLIDFGSAHVAGLAEIASPVERCNVPGAIQYMAPEYFLGESGSPASDLFSLAAITYQLLCGRLPYGADVARCRSRAAQNRLRYRRLLGAEGGIPAWVDETLKKALQPNRNRRYQELSEFVYDLRHPNVRYQSMQRLPLMERRPLAFWQGLSFILAVLVLYLLGRGL